MAEYKEFPGFGKFGKIQNNKSSEKPNRLSYARIALYNFEKFQ